VFELKSAAGYYSAGLTTCVNPTLLTSRNIGVAGGKSEGIRKFVSN